MKKYARLRSTSSLPEQCEPCDGGKPEVASTALSLDDDDVVVDTVRSPAIEWNSLKLSPRPGHGSKHDHGDELTSNLSSHRVLADALKKLSSLRDTHHDIDDPLPRRVSTTSHSWGTRIVSDSDAGGGESHSTFFSGSWQRPRSTMGADSLQSSSFRSCSNGGGAVGSIRTESSCNHTSHFTHRRSSSMHDFTTLGGQPYAARPTTSIGGLHPTKTGFVPCFQNDSEQRSPPQRRISSCTSMSASARRLAAVSANSPLQLSKSCSLWEESDDPAVFGAGRSSAKRAGAVQSMRYDRLQCSGASSGLGLGKEEKELQSQSVREGAAHAQAIAAMAKAYAEKYGVAQAVVECVSCGRGLGVIVEGNSPGSYDSSFCRSCRPPLLPVVASASASASAPSSSSWKKGASGMSRGMMHYCRKLLVRMGKKPSHKYTMV